MFALLNALRAMPRPTEAQRVFHGRGGLHPGHEAWAFDAYPPVFVFTSFEPVAEEALAVLHGVLAERWAQIAPGEPLNWVYQARHGVRTETRLMAGSVPEPHTVAEDGLQFLVHVLKGQNHGLFLDMAEGRRWVRRWAQAQPGGKVLNLFAYTCAFSVVARQAGAAQVVNIDMAGGALATGQRNHALNGVSSGVSFLAHDLFTSWGKLTRSGPYDLVVADPPSYQKGSFVATKDYARVIRRLPALLAPGGHALLCLNAPELGPAFLQDLVQAEAPELQWVQRLGNPAAFADVSEDRALKVLLYRAPA
ncbi:SAM-dependent methyltransferase [beta proteobacterium AAP121]|nr:SAM-dependent methyltransferase [beta proteobacterium AAP65]KPF95105.1 SAM-dependent methyltransferase [beta proteobacterium AAP121]